MSKELIENYLRRGISDEKSLKNSIDVLQFIVIISSVILIIVGIAAMQQNMLAGAGVLIFVFINYLVMMFLNGIGKALLNIQRASFITMLNTSKANTDESFALLNGSLPVDIKSEANKNMSQIIEDEGKNKSSNN